jgi:DNA ligase (NAD+)
MIALKNKIIENNMAYRQGDSIISDEQYDSLLDEYSKMIPLEEFKNFTESLLENSGKIKHKFVIGSLKKKKANTDDLDKWIEKWSVDVVMLSSKIDGMSFVLEYYKGSLIGASTRGDGVSGEDRFDKAQCIDSIPKTLKRKITGYVRGELVIKNSLFESEECFNDYKHPRGAIVGLINNKEIKKDALRHATFYSHQLMGSNMRRIQQYELLNEEFVVPMWTKLKVDENIHNNFKHIYNEFVSNEDLEIDGLVVCDLNYDDENIYHPTHSVAYKFNELTGESKICGVNWKLSASGKYIPVLKVEPVELGGSTIRNISGYNYRNIIEQKYCVGTKIEVQKSGDIIPICKRIIGRTEEKYTLFIPTHCKSCGEELHIIGVDLKCTNKNCPNVLTKKVNKFLRSCGVEGFSEKSLINQREI